MQYDKINTNINTNESKLSEIGPVRQNPMQRTVRTAHLSVLMTVHNFSTTVQNRTDRVSDRRAPDTDLFTMTQRRELDEDCYCY